MSTPAPTPAPEPSEAQLAIAAKIGGYPWPNEYADIRKSVHDSALLIAASEHAAVQQASRDLTEARGLVRHFEFQMNTRIKDTETLRQERAGLRAQLAAATARTEQAEDARETWMVEFGSQDAKFQEAKRTITAVREDALRWQRVAELRADTLRAASKYIHANFDPGPVPGEFPTDADWSCYGITQQIDKVLAATASEQPAQVNILRLYCTDRETGKGYLIKIGPAESINLELAGMLAGGRDAWVRPDASIAEQPA